MCETRDDVWMNVGVERLSALLSASFVGCHFQHLGGVTPRVDVASELLLRIEFLVFLNSPPLRHQTRNDGQSTSGDNDTTTSLVPWLL